MSGTFAGPLFIVTVLIQDYTRAGFDPRVHMLSLLSLGSLGWIQVVNFVLTGILNVLYSVGLRRELKGTTAGTAGAVFIRIYGFGLILVGIFRTDPSDGFPPGIASVKPPSVHGFIHGLGALVVFVGLSVALISLSRALSARGDRRWSLLTLSSAAVMLLIFFTGFAYPAVTARTLRLAVLVGWGTASAVAARLLNKRIEPSETSRAVDLADPCGSVSAWP